MKRVEVEKIIVEKFQADDGKLFDSEIECQIYEGRQYLKLISNYCRNTEDCPECVLYKAYGCDCPLRSFPNNWAISQMD